MLHMIGPSLRRNRARAGLRGARYLLGSLCVVLACGGAEGETETERSGAEATCEEICVLLEVCGLCFVDPDTGTCRSRDECEADCDGGDIDEPTAVCLQQVDDCDQLELEGCFSSR